MARSRHMGQSLNMARSRKVVQSTGHGSLRLSGSVDSLGLLLVHGFVDQRGSLLRWVRHIYWLARLGWFSLRSMARSERLVQSTPLARSPKLVQSLMVARSKTTACGLGRCTMARSGPVGQS